METRLVVVHEGWLFGHSTHPVQLRCRCQHVCQLSVCTSMREHTSMHARMAGQRAVCWVRGRVRRHSGIICRRARARWPLWLPASRCSGSPWSHCSVLAFSQVRLANWITPCVTSHAGLLPADATQGLCSQLSCGTDSVAPPLGLMLWGTSMPSSMPSKALS